MSILGITKKLPLPQDKIGATDEVIVDGITSISKNTAYLSAVVGSTDEAYIYLSTTDGSVLQNYTFNTITSNGSSVNVLTETISPDKDVLTIQYTPASNGELDTGLVTLAFPALATQEVVNKTVIDTAWVPPFSSPTEVIPPIDIDGNPYQVGVSGIATDDYSYRIDTPFDFIYNGTNYGNGNNGGIYIGTNGYLTFGQGSNRNYVNIHSYYALPMGLGNGIAINSGDYSAVSITYASDLSGPVQKYKYTLHLDSQRRFDGSVDTVYSITLMSNNNVLIECQQIGTPPSPTVSGLAVYDSYWGVRSYLPLFNITNNSRVFLDFSPVGALSDASLVKVTENYPKEVHTKVITSTVTHIPTYNIYLGLQATVSPTEFTVSPNTFDFGNINPNESGTTNITLSWNDPTINTDLLSVGYASVDPDDAGAFFVQGRAFIRNSATSLTIPVVFKPVISKVHSATLMVFYNGVPVDAVVSLTGSNSSLPVSLPTPPIKSTVPAPTFTSEVYQTITNGSQKTMRITDVVISSDALGEFQIVNYDLLIGLVLRPLESVSIPITYTPKQQYYTVPQLSVHSVLY